MARGDVLSLKRRIGFAGGGSVERFVVLQSDRLSAALETILVAPLDSALDVYASFPGAVPVSAHEAGARSGQVVLVPLLSAIASSRFEADAVGRLRRDSLARVERVARLALELP